MKLVISNSNNSKAINSLFRQVCGYPSSRRSLPEQNYHVEYVVNHYEDECGMTAHGRNLTMDRFYGDLALSRWLLDEKGITRICTMRCYKINLTKTAMKIGTHPTIHCVKGTQQYVIMYLK